VNGLGGEKKRGLRLFCSEKEAIIREFVRLWKIQKHIVMGCVPGKERKNRSRSLRGSCVLEAEKERRKEEKKKMDRNVRVKKQRRTFNLGGKVSMALIRLKKKGRKEAGRREGAGRG